MCFRNARNDWSMSQYCVKVGQSQLFVDQLGTRSRVVSTPGQNVPPLSPRQTVLRWSCGSVVASTVFIYRRSRWTCVLETPEMIGACHNIASKLAKVNFSWTSSGPGLGWFPLQVKMSHLCPLAKQCSGGRAGPIEHPYDSPT